MSDSTPLVENTDDLASFEADFFQKTPVAKEKVKAEEPAEAETPDESDEDEIDDDAIATDADDEADEPDEDESEDEPEPAKKNRKSAKDRIQELNTKLREAERRETETLRRLALVEARESPKPTEEVKAPAPTDAPNPDAEVDGKPLYPLGEFDPAYIRDLTRFTIKQEQTAAETFRRERETQEASANAREAARVKWVERLDQAEDEIPDVRDKIATIGDMFTNIDQGYGQYLVDVVQSLEAGPRILAYLADNPKAAREIVSSGPASATLALGRLDAKLSKTETKAPVAKPTRAPSPPKTTRGTAGRFANSADTDDLDAFERQFFQKKK